MGAARLTGRAGQGNVGRTPDVGPDVTVTEGAPRGARTAGRLGMVAGVGAVAILGVMHLVGPSSAVDPVRRTISEYALVEGGWLFDVAVVALALGSAAVLGALVTVGLTPARSAPPVLLGLWSVGLLLVVVFEKTNWSIGPSVAGYIHRYASLAAFVALPVGTLLLVRRWRGDRRWRGFTRPLTVLAALALAAFLPIVVAIAARGVLGVPWWRAVPLGLLERVLALAEVVVVVVLGAWTVARADRGP